MNDELITRLRAMAGYYRGRTLGDKLGEAADALEAARAEAARLSEAEGVALGWIKRLQAERDAEAALADQLAEALGHTSPYVDWNPFNRYERAEGRDEALAAHRERRTKENQ